MSELWNSLTSQILASLFSQAKNQTPTLTLGLNANTYAYTHKENYKVPKNSH